MADVTYAGATLTGVGVKAKGGCGSARRLDDKAAAFLRSAAERLGWSGRRLHRTLKVSRTVADLAGSETVAVAHVAEALQAQRALA